MRTEAEIRYRKNRAAKRKRREQRERRRRRLRVIAGEVLLIVVFLCIFCLGRWRGGGVRDIPASLSDILTGSGSVEDFAEAHGLSMEEYPQELLDLYERNPEARDFVCEYPLKKDEQPEIDLSGYAGSQTVPLFLQWDERWGYKQYSGNVMGLTGCGPTCLSMVAVYLRGDTSMDPAWMADFATGNGYAAEGNGSAWTLFSEGGGKLGLDVTEIPLDRDRIMDNLEAGNPIVAVMGPGDFTTTGHFIVFTGCENGGIHVNDPNSRKNSEKLWDYDDIKGQIRALWVFRRLG